jgi:hypothetical protein
MFAWRSRLCCVPITCDEQHNRVSPPAVLVEPETEEGKKMDQGAAMAACTNLHFDAVIQDLFLGDELDDVVGDGQKPAHFFLPPPLPVRGHGLQLPLLAKHRGCR